MRWPDAERNLRRDHQKCDDGGCADNPSMHAVQLLPGLPQIVAGRVQLRPQRGEIDAHVVDPVQLLTLALQVCR